MTDPRYLAAKLLDKTFSSGSYSNLQLNSGLDRYETDDRGRRLCTAIYYGVIQRKLTIDYILAQYCSRPLAKMDSIIVTILRCGVYQILYMDGVPDNAAVNESVALAKKFGKTSASGMVNAVLRNFLRSGKEYKLPKNDIAALSVMYSIPEPFVQSFISDYGRDTAVKFMEQSLDTPKTYLRKNPLKCTDDELKAALGKDIEITGLHEDCFSAGSGDVTSANAFKSGFFHVQDISSQMCCMVLAPTENDCVLDICAAPGGKTFTMAELMKGRGEIHAFDLHEKRVKLIRSGAERLGLANISAKSGDASKFDPNMPLFTKILCDVPCSGFGVIRHKPEIKYKSLSDFEGLPEIQYNIASNALNYLAAGGEMVYSTCTVRRTENEEVVKRLLENHSEIEIVPLPEIFGRKYDNPLTLFPEISGGNDGFFIAKFRKIIDESR